MNYSTADLCDQYSDIIKVAEPIFKSFGAQVAFGGQISTVKVYEDNSLIKELLAQPGQGRVLVIDGGGSLRRALLGDLLAKQAVAHHWAGVIVYGCVRDSAVLANIPLGIKALNTHPLKSIKRGRGDTEVPVTFAGVTFFPERFVYADQDGMIVSEHILTLE
ncbi:MAG: ribonuclease E activity regulator RraA [Pseudomonadota bacterium]|nr:ribonuclease E activity regulator RraA [Pseudomonadota bacterium]